MFKPQEFLKELGRDLVSEFSRGSYGTTPGLIGASRESAVKKQLSRLLPEIVSIGSGCVIDSYGGTSKQQDIVIYERNYCPVFSINDSPDATYYPCESVAAVGEVKSTLGRRELEDSFEKIKSAKALLRYSEDTLKWRSYGSSMGVVGAESERFSQDKKVSDQLLGFIICKKLGLTKESFLNAYRELSKDIKPHLRPNICISLEDGIVLNLDHDEMTVRWNSYEATGVALVGIEESKFQYLLARIYWQITHGRTSNTLPFHKYILKDNTATNIIKYVPF